MKKNAPVSNDAEGQTEPGARPPARGRGAKPAPGDPAKPFVSKRGRPTSSQVAAIDQHTLTVARSMFLENGFANTAMETIAATAGISKGTLYSRYPDKSALFNAVVADRLAVWGQDKIATASREAASDVERLHQFGMAFITGMRVPEVAAFHHLIVAEAYRFPDLAQQFYDKGYVEAIELVAASFSKAAADSRWPIADARVMVQAFVSALLGWLDVQSLRAPLTDAMCEAYVARLVAIFVGGRSGW